MIGAFTFEEGGRTYRCAPESRAPLVDGTWWWFDVSNDGNRYAAFAAAAGDTQKSVRARIVEWYERRLFVRSQPSTPPERFGGRPRKPGAAPPAAGAPGRPRAGNGK
jgi:hypothetical protein